MKLYLADGQYAGTQAEAKRLGRFTAVEVPTDKPSLIAWLNEQLGLQHSVAAPVAIQLACAPPTQAAESTERVREQQRRDISIEEAIGEADYPRAIRLAEHIHCRLMEHARAGAK